MLSFYTILHPTDLSEEAATALQVARALARDGKGRLVLLTVVPSSPPPIEAYVSAEVFDRDLAAAKQHISQLAATIDDVPVTTVVESGDTGEVILRTAEDVQADLIVMGTHGRRGLGRLVMGSVAEFVVRLAPCPVLTIRPGVVVESVGSDGR